MLTQIRKSFCSSSHASCAVEFSFALFKLLKMFEQNKESGAVFIGMELAWVERQLQPDLGFQFVYGISKPWSVGPTCLRGISSSTPLLFFLEKQQQQQP
ncbi:hypothetical protein CFP56_004851 [Quercus suber]|uniref:Uncharacterized protein n=1 Tax=Quercus suber TaxID=58331 RepID=A0AAW0MA55_QUESU